MLWLCGLYRFENEMPVFVILTRDANPNILIEKALTKMVSEKA